MTRKSLPLVYVLHFSALCAILAISALSATAQALSSDSLERDPKQALDETYTEHIKKYTTAPALNSPLTDYLPASSTVPTPAKVLGDVAGRPTCCPMRKRLPVFSNAGGGQPAGEEFSQSAIPKKGAR